MEEAKLTNNSATDECSSNSDASRQGSLTNINFHFFSHLELHYRVEII